MGAPSQDQIDEAIAFGLSRGHDEDTILADLATLERMSDEELAAEGIFPPGYTPPAPVGPTAAPSAEPLPPFPPAPTSRHRAGWTAERQRLFIEALAESGSVSEASAAVGLSARSAYKLRHRPGAEGFNEAWVHAESLAATRLTAIAFDRAIHGKSEYYYKDGELVGERRAPSDRLLMWLIAHLDPAGFGHSAKKDYTNPRYRAAERLPDLLADFTDVAEADCATEPAEYAPIEAIERASRA